MTTVVSLTTREGTSDYERQYEEYLKAVGIALNVIFIDADPTTTAVVQSVFPAAHVQWCIWHITENINKKLRYVIHDEGEFWRRFYEAQSQISPAVSTELSRGLP